MRATLLQDFEQFTLVHRHLPSPPLAAPSQSLQSGKHLRIDREPPLGAAAFTFYLGNAIR
jgi:hypothetical protein